MSKKRAPKPADTLPNTDQAAATEQIANVRPTESADDSAVSPLNGVTNAVESGVSVEDAPAAPESERRAKGKRSKRGKKDKPVNAADGYKKEKREKKEKRSKKHKKEEAAKAVKPDKKAKRDKPRGKKDKSTLAPELRPLRKVNVVLIEPNGQPRAHFDGEIGVLDLLLPKQAEGDDSGT